MNTLATLSIFLLTLAAWPAAAHQGESHIRGTVTAMSANNLEVEGEDGKTVSIRLDSATDYRYIEGKITESHPSAGSRVIVDLKSSGDEQTAKQVRFSPAAEQGHAGHSHGAKEPMDHHDAMGH